MHYQHLKNFITNKIRQNDIFVPAMILYLVKNDGQGEKEDIAKLIYIFDYQHSISHYETIVEKFTSVLLDEYHIIEKSGEHYSLRTWPLNQDEINDIIRICSKVSNGFFKNLKNERVYH